MPEILQSFTNLMKIRLKEREVYSNNTGFDKIRWVKRIFE